jgi:hypothetical protein
MEPFFVHTIFGSRDNGEFDGWSFHSSHDQNPRRIPTNAKHTYWNVLVNAEVD